MVKKCRIDIESGWRYLEVIPFSDIKDEMSNKVLTPSEAIQRGKVDFGSMLKVLEAQASTGGIIDMATGKRVTLASALEQKLVDESMARIIASHQVLTGGIIDIYNDQRVTLSDAVEKRLISPELVTMIQADTSGKQGGTGVCELKGAFLRKFRKATRESYDKEKHEGVLQVGSQCAQEKANVRVSHGEKVGKGKKISVEMESQRQDEEKVSSDNEVSASIVSPGGLEGESAHQVLVTHPCSGSSDLKLIEEARSQMKHCTEVEQEEAVAQMKMTPHVKQSTPGLDAGEARDCPGRVGSKGQEPKHEPAGKLSSAQAANVEVGRRGRRETGGEERVQTNKVAAGPSEEKLDQEVTIGDEHGSFVKSQSMKTIGNDRGKEGGREKDFSLVCKTEGFPSQMTFKDASLENQNALTFFSEGETKTVNLCSILKQREKLSQETASTVQKEPFSSEIPRPERLNSQESDGESHISDMPCISKGPMAAQITTRQETTDDQDLSIASKTAETKKRKVRSQGNANSSSSPALDREMGMA